MTLRIGKRNSTYQILDALKRNRVKRKQTGSFIVEGVGPIDALIAQRWCIEAFVYSAARSLSDWALRHIKAAPLAQRYELSPELMDELSDRDETSELIVVAKIRELSLDDLPGRLRLVVLLDRPSNPGNTGSIFRSADAFGAEAIIISGHGVDPYDTRVVRSSLGTVCTVPFVADVSNAALESWLSAARTTNRGLTVVGTSAHGPVDIDRAGPLSSVLLILGNETYGMSRFSAELCDVVARIPMGGSVSSLNVACAATVALYEISRRAREERLE